MTYSYEDIISILNNECNKINISFPDNADGRITSAIKEDEYIYSLKQLLNNSYPELVFETQAVKRWWWDFRINNIPFNLKLTTGGRDNALNKVAVLYSIVGKEIKQKNINFNKFFKILKETRYENRNHMNEYHYLVVNKKSGEVLIKSIFDIHTYFSNPCNYLQISWANEFKNSKYKTKDIDIKNKITTLITTIQESIIKSISAMNEFANADIHKEIFIHEPSHN